MLIVFNSKIVFINILCFTVCQCLPSPIGNLGDLAGSSGGFGGQNKNVPMNQMGGGATGKTSPMGGKTSPMGGRSPMGGSTPTWQQSPKHQPSAGKKINKCRNGYAQNKKQKNIAPWSLQSAKRCKHNIATKESLDIFTLLDVLLQLPCTFVVCVVGAWQQPQQAQPQQPKPTEPKQEAQAPNYNRSNFSVIGNRADRGVRKTGGMC